VTLSDIAFGAACFALGFVVATVMWLVTFRSQQKAQQNRALDRQLRMQQNYGLGQGRRVSEEQDGQ